MDSYQGRVLQSFRRETGWFKANPQYVAGNPQLGAQVEALDGIVIRMSDHAAAQDTQRAQSLLISKDETEQRTEVLWHQMAPIAKVGRGLRGTVPGIGVLVTPKGNVSTPELITAATAMAQKAETYKDVLLESGLPADFIEQLQTATAALKGSIDGRGLARASRAAATRGVAAEMAQGRRIVTIIDAVITRLLRSDPVKLAEWNQLKRVEVKPVTAHAPIALVDTPSKPAETPSTEVLPAAGNVVKAA